MFPKRRLTAVLLLVLILSLVTACSLLNSPPVADFFVFPDSGSAPLVVSFDASSSSDTGGIIVTYRWAFGYGTTGSGKVKTHTYNSVGIYTAQLTVTDDDGATDSATRAIQVSAGPIASNPPTASFTASPTSGQVPLTVSFNASGSSDSDGSISSYAWTFGDGRTASGVTVAHTYSSPGTYTATLTVSDNDGATDSTTDVLQISANEELTVANALVGSGRLPFCASGSSRMTKLST